jgi:hypothetical protein
MPRLLRAATTAAIALLIAGCGGSTATPAATSTTAPTTAPTAAATPAPSDVPSASPAASADTGAISDFASRLAALDGYEITMTIDGPAGKTSIDNTTVHKPTDASKYVVSSPDGKQVAIVRIGEDAWISQDGTTIVSVPASSVDSMIATVKPEVLLAAFDIGTMASDLVAQGTETKNGVQATKYHIDDSLPVPAGGPTIPPGMAIDYWVTDDGLLVALEASGVGSASNGQFDTLDVQMTHVNDPALTIDRPS